MSLLSWFSFPSRKTPCTPAGRRQSRPGLEVLEDRCCPSGFFQHGTSSTGNHTFTFTVQQPNATSLLQFQMTMDTFLVMQPFISVPKQPTNPFTLESRRGAVAILDLAVFKEHASAINASQTQALINDENTLFRGTASQKSAAMTSIENNPIYLNPFGFATGLTAGLLAAQGLRIR
jgi:hypothetical protein